MKIGDLVFLAAGAPLYSHHHLDKRYNSLIESFPNADPCDAYIIIDVFNTSVNCHWLYLCGKNGIICTLPS